MRKFLFSSRDTLPGGCGKTPVFWCRAPGNLELSSGKFSTDAVEATTGFRGRRLEGALFVVRSMERMGVNSDFLIGKTSGADPNSN